MRPSQEGLPSSKDRKYVMKLNRRKPTPYFKQRRFCLKPKKLKKIYNMFNEILRGPEYWLGLYLFESNVDKKKNKFETCSLTLQEKVEELHTTLTVS